MKLSKILITSTLILSSLYAAGTNAITIKGSDTMVHLVSMWSEKFMAANAGSQISVTGGGSGTGIAAIINGTTDICAASREISTKEMALAKKQNVNPVELIVANDGIAIVVNPVNPIKELTIEQIGKIYTGLITNWKEVGGPDQKIYALSRESSSGTYVFFQEVVLNKQDYAASVRKMPATSAIVQSVSQDKWSIGYVGLGYAESSGDKLKVVPVKKDAGSKAILPNVETITSGEYGIARGLQLYTNGNPEGITKSFLQYVMSVEGQKIVVETGYVSVNKPTTAKK